MRSPFKLTENKKNKLIIPKGHSVDIINENDPYQYPQE